MIAKTLIYPHTHKESMSVGPKNAVSLSLYTSDINESQSREHGDNPDFFAHEKKNYWVLKRIVFIQCFSIHFPTFLKYSLKHLCSLSKGLFSDFLMQFLKQFGRGKNRQEGSTGKTSICCWESVEF